MGDEQRNLSGRVGLDTTDFKAGIQACDRELRRLDSSFAASTAKMGDWSSSANGLETRIKTLTDKIEIQKEKVNNLKAEHDRIVESEGEHSRAAVNLEIKLNKATAALGSMEYELNKDTKSLTDMKNESGAASEQVKNVGDNSKDAGEKMKTAGTKADGFKTAISGILTVAGTVVGIILAIATAAVGAALGFGELAGNIAETCDNLVELSDKTSIDVETLQELQYIAAQTGTDFDTMTSAISRLTRSMWSAKDGEGAVAEAFKQLGVDIYDANGNLRPAKEVFDELIDKLGQIQNPTERDALAMQIFGKNAQELNPLIKAGSQGMSDMAQEARDLGAVLDEDTVQAFADLKDQADALKAGLGGIGGALIAPFAPLFAGILGSAKGYLGQLTQIIKDSGGDPKKLIPGISGLIKTIMEDITTQIPELANTATEIIKTLADELSKQIPVLTPVAINLILTLVQALLDNSPTLTMSAVNLIIALGAGLLASTPILLSAAGSLLSSFLSGFVSFYASLFETGFQIVQQVLNGILGNVDLVPTIQGKIQEIINAAKLKAAEFLSIGTSFVDGLKKGIQNAWAGLLASVNALIAQLPASVRKFLGMASPSKVGVDIGFNFGSSIGLGFMDAINRAEMQLAGAMSGFGRTAYAGASAGAVNSQSMQQDNFTFWAPVFINDATPGGLADQLTSKRF